MQLFPLIVPFIYYLYLLDPFTSKVQKRNYKKLINNSSYFNVHLLCSLLVAIILLITAAFKSNYLGLNLGCLTPFLFVILVKVFNSYSREKYKRDFYLVLRGDTFNYSTFDLIASISLLIFPLFILPLIIEYTDLKFQ